MKLKVYFYWNYNWRPIDECNSLANQIADKSAQQGFNQSRLPVFTADQKLLVQGSADFLGINHYTSFLTENKPSNISDVSYEADQDVYTYYDPSWYG